MKHLFLYIKLWNEYIHFKIEQNEILNKHNSIYEMNYYMRTLNIIEKQIVSNYNFNKYGIYKYLYEIINSFYKYKLRKLY